MAGNFPARYLSCMPVFTAQQLHKSHGSRVLFSGISFTIGRGEKVGFIGPNGAGKSTLFRIVAGLESADSGILSVQRGATVGYLAQEPDFAATETIRSAVSGGRAGMNEAFEEFRQIASQMERGAGDDERLLARQGELMARIDALGGWQWQHEVESMLTQLGISDWDRPVASLSGGERKRVALARVLLDRPDLLLLDEPTNHLDADTTLWLEDHLLEYPGAVMLITHDRYVLDRVVERMLEIGVDEFATYRGGYTEYLEEKAERMARESREAAKRDRLLEQELAWVKRSPAARTGKQKARIKRLDALRTEKASAPSGSSELELRFGEPPRLGRTVLEFDQISKGFGDRTLIDELSLDLRAGERIGIIGPNGAGKTTLLRLILGQESPDRGEITFGVNTRVAYFDQTRSDLDPDRSVYESVADEDWVHFGGRKVHLRSYLESFLFPTRMQDQRVGSLSGGERNRVLLARLLLEEANLLILDEPTNDLDLPTLQILESALADYSGCVLVVTHDRFFLDKVATGLLVFEGDGVVHRHEGGYDLYRRLREAKQAEVVPAARPPAREGKARERPRERRLSYQEKRELEKIEEVILAAEAEREHLGTELSDPSLYADTPEKVGPLTAAFEEAGRRVEELYQRWAELDAIANGSSGEAGA